MGGGGSGGTMRSITVVVLPSNDEMGKHVTLKHIVANWRSVKKEMGLIVPVGIVAVALGVMNTVTDLWRELGGKQVPIANYAVDVAPTVLGMWGLILCYRGIRSRLAVGAYFEKMRQEHLKPK